MKLLAKFNLILVVLFGAGLFLVSHYAREFLMENARRQVLAQAQLMIESARATRDYTNTEVKPLLVKLPDQTEFIKQTVPAYSAKVIFDRVRNSYPDYTYKEATINPTNPIDRAVDWETDIINYFRNYSNEKELVGERDTPTGRSLYLAHPMRAPKACLGCHSSPEVAPASMIRTYGSANGFGWKEDDVIAAQIVSVPMALPIGIADSAYKRLLLYLIAVFVLTIIAIDTLLVMIVIRPVRRLAEQANRISKGETNLPELPAKGNDEIADVTRSFNRMYVSLAKALQLLEN
jgi:methyl-accepting chemotaxis protein